MPSFIPNLANLESDLANNPPAALSSQVEEFQQNIAEARNWAFAIHLNMLHLPIQVRLVGDLQYELSILSRTNHAFAAKYYPALSQAGPATTPPNGLIDIIDGIQGFLQKAAAVAVLHDQYLSDPTTTSATSTPEERGYYVTKLKAIVACVEDLRFAREITAFDSKAPNGNGLL